MIILNDFTVPKYEDEFLRIQQISGEKRVEIFLSKKQSTDLLEFLEGIREAL